MQSTKKPTRKQATKDPHQPWPPDEQPVKPVRIVCDPASLEPKDYKQWFVYRPTIKIELKVGESVQVQFERVRVCGHLPSGPAEVQLIPTVTFDGAEPGPEQWANSPPLGQIATIVEQGVAPNSDYRWVVDNSAWLNRPIDYTAKYALLTSVLNFGDGYPRDVLLTWVQRTSLVDVFLGDGTPLMWSVILPEVTASSDKQISFRIRPNMGL
ncbi:MAG: hypothetical protein EBT61_22390, partial [Verrucomicrobia bacterium]|nr:hypothetical protein [Verrucomicrobiota bacterium]